MPLSFCFNVRCNYVSSEPLEICPQCGRKLLNSKQVKRSGWFQLASGLLIVGMVGFITYKLAPNMLQAFETAEPNAPFTGQAQEALVMLTFFVALLLIGTLGSMVAILQIKTGRRNKYMTFMLLGILGFILIMGWLIQQRIII